MAKGKINLLNIKLYLEYYKKDITDKYSKLIENIVLDKDVLNILNEKIYITTLDKYYKLQRKNNNLNKGIDELLNKYEDYTNNIFTNMSILNEMTEQNFQKYDKDIVRVWAKYSVYTDFIQDLKKLKGE